MPEFQVDLVVRGATVVTPSGRALADVVVGNGRIVDVVSGRWDGHAPQTIDASGLIAMPGGVDTHVHLMEPGDMDRETFVDGSSAAAGAGVTTIIEHTHGWPVHELERLRGKRDHLRGRSHVDFGLAAHVWPDRISELGALWNAGIAFFKVFTCTTHGVPGLGTGDLMGVFTELASRGAPCLVHCEDDGMTAEAERLLRLAGRDDPGLIKEWRSREAEMLAVTQVVAAASLAGNRTRVAHASNPDVLALVREARGQGARVSAETCPQYLVLREDEVNAHGALRKFTPPARVRSDDEEAAMWAAVNYGDADQLSSDHAPSTRAQKAGDFWRAPFGLPGLDTTYPLLVDAALTGRTSLERVAAVYSENPAAFFGLARKGRLAPGMDADLVLIDPAQRWTISPTLIRSKAGWSPYEGRRLRGRVVTTVVRGNVVMSEGAVLEPRLGRFLSGGGAQADCLD